MYCIMVATPQKPASGKTFEDITLFKYKLNYVILKKRQSVLHLPHSNKISFVDLIENNNEIIPQLQIFYIHLFIFNAKPVYRGHEWFQTSHNWNVRRYHNI